VAGAAGALLGDNRELDERRALVADGTGGGHAGAGVEFRFDAAGLERADYVASDEPDVRGRDADRYDPPAEYDLGLADCHCGAAATGRRDRPWGSHDHGERCASAHSRGPELVLVSGSTWVALGFWGALALAALGWLLVCILRRERFGGAQLPRRLIGVSLGLFLVYAGYHLVMFTREVIS